jgi:hypothetical protein
MDLDKKKKKELMYTTTKTFSHILLVKLDLFSISKQI